MSRQSLEFFRHAEALSQSHEDFITVTWVRSEGHAPQDIGAKAIVTRRGLHWGTVGGGKVEGRAITFSQELLTSPDETTSPLLLRWDLQKDIGMSCGGAVTMLFERFLARPWSVVVFGAGHVGQALVRSLALLDCHVTCVDTRREWLDRLPPAQAGSFAIHELDNMAQFARDLPESTYCVLVTKGHDTDVPILRELLKKSKLPYLGVIGSKVKGRILRADMMREGFSREDASRFHCPLGLAMGTHQPAEIAVSIVAQLLMTKNKISLNPENEAD